MKSGAPCSRVLELAHQQHPKVEGGGDKAAFLYKLLGQKSNASQRKNGYHFYSLHHCGDGGEREAGKEGYRKTSAQLIGDEVCLTARRPHINKVPPSVI